MLLPHRMVPNRTFLLYVLRSGTTKKKEKENLVGLIKVINTLQSLNTYLGIIKKSFISHLAVYPEKCGPMYCTRNYLLSEGTLHHLETYGTKAGLLKEATQ